MIQTGLLQIKLYRGIFSQREIGNCGMLSLNPKWELYSLDISEKLVQNGWCDKKWKYIKCLQLKMSVHLFNKPNTVTTRE